MEEPRFVSHSRGEKMVRVMIVEDESLVAKDIRNRLQKLGYAVSAMVSSGHKALQEVEEAQPDIVLMDIVLKGDIDGIEAAAAIRSRFRIPVIYVTAYADVDIMERAKTTEPYGYLLKPLDDRELLMTIEMALYKHKIEKDLKEREKWLIMTLRSIGEGIITCDTKGNVTFMNAAAESMTGWTQEDAVGKPLAEVFHTIGENRECELFFEEVIKKGEIIHLAASTVLVTKDGTEKSITDSGAPIRDEDGTILGAVFVIRDAGESDSL